MLDHLAIWQSALRLPPRFKNQTAKWCRQSWMRNPMIPALRQAVRCAFARGFPPTRRLSAHGFPACTETRARCLAIRVPSRWSSERCARLDASQPAEIDPTLSVARQFNLCVLDQKRAALPVHVPPIKSAALRRCRCRSRRGSASPAPPSGCSRREGDSPVERSQVGDPFDRAAPHGLWSRHDQTVFRRTIGQACRRLSSEFASQPSTRKCRR